MATPTSLHPHARPRYRYAPWHIAVVALALLFALVLLVGGRTLSRASFVPRVEVVNASEYEVDLDVTTGPHGGWMGVGVAQPRATTSFEDIYDQGATWILRFGVQGHIVERTIARAELQREQWRVHVPDELAVRLRASGVSPTPKLAGP